MRDALREAAAEAVRFHTDEDYFRAMVAVVFYSGMRAAAVSDRIDTIRKHFPSYSVVAKYGEEEILAILADPEMLKNERKIRACVHNAKKFVEIVNKPGLFAQYLGETHDVEVLRKKLMKNFKFLGKITSFHYLMDIGYNLVKPDRVVSRIFSRLRLVEGLPNPDNPDPSKLTDEQLWQIVRMGQTIAESVNQPIRYVDLVFVAYGQVEGSDPDGLPQGVCLDANPRCWLCGVRPHCRYEPKTVTALA